MDCVITPVVAACIAVPLVICLVPPLAFATGACLMATAVCVPAMCIGACVLPCAACAQCCCPQDQSYPAGQCGRRFGGTYYEYRYWSPSGYSRETGEDFGNGTYLIVNERVFRDEAPAGSGNGGMRIEELDASAEQKGGAVAEPKKDK